MGVYIGKRTQTFSEALENAGYSPSSIDEVILTHYHLDHAGVLSLFPQAKILIAEKDREKLNNTDNLNVIPVVLENNPMYGFRGSYKVANNIYMLNAAGHTAGHSIVLVYNEKKQNYVLIAGDSSVADETLVTQSMMRAYEDLQDSENTLQKIKVFIDKEEVLYLTSHKPTPIKQIIDFIG